MEILALALVSAVACFALWIMSSWMRRENEAHRAHLTHMVSLIKVAHPKELEATAEQMFGEGKTPPQPKDPTDDVDAELGIPQ